MRGIMFAESDNNNLIINDSYFNNSISMNGLIFYSSGCINNVLINNSVILN